MINKIRYYIQRLRKRWSKEPDLQAELLRSYLKKGSQETLKRCDQLIDTDEGLKHFGKMWGEYKTETMLVLTALEYEYIQNYDFTKQEVQAIKHFIGNLALFYKGCKDAHEARLAERAKREH